MNPTDLAYIAGFLDGEGVVTLQKIRTRGGRGIRHAILEWIRDTLGVGTVYHGARPWKPQWARVGHYQVSHRAARRVLELLLPYLRIKRRHAELVLALPLMPKGHFDPAIYARKVELLTAIRTLNNRQKEKRSYS